jgi:hypothetical protein
VSDALQHWNEENLIEYHYGESAEDEAIASHLRQCADCARSYAAIVRDLSEISAPATPSRGDEYGREVWDAIRGSLRAYPEKQKAGWLGFLSGAQWKGFAVAAACLMVMVAAFLTGRWWEHRHTTQTIATDSANPARERVVLVVMGDHLDRSERLLVELKHAAPDVEAPMQQEARDLLAANRLYRVSAQQAGDVVLAGALDRLERVLIEVANEPAGLTQARLTELQQEMNTDGLLFEVRVLRSRVQNDVDRQQNTPAKTKGVSI